MGEVRSSSERERKEASEADDEPSDVAEREPLSGLSGLGPSALESGGATRRRAVGMG